LARGALPGFANDSLDDVGGPFRVLRSEVHVPMWPSVELARGALPDFANDSLELVTVGRWPFPAGCFHLASPWLASSYRRSTLAPPSASPSKTRWASRGPCSTAANRRGFRAPLMGFSQRSPLRRSHPVRPLPANRGSRMPPLEHVPSLSFLPTSTVYSAQGLAGLLHPAADHGVRLVSSRPPTDADARHSPRR